MLVAIGAALLVAAAVAMASFFYFVNGISAGLASLFSAPVAQEAPQDVGWTQPFMDIDFATAPVDLVIDTAAGRFLLRDQARLQQIATTGFPDFSKAETGMTLLSILFMSPSGPGGPGTGLTFMRDGQVLAQASCWTVVCGDDPELTAYLDKLTRDARQLVSE